MKPSVSAFLAVAAVAASACSNSPVAVGGPTPPGPSTSRPTATAWPGGSNTRVVLIEAKGPRPESDAFVSRFGSEVSDRGLFVFVDARDAGVTYASLVTQPEGDTAVAFLKEWPADAYLLLELPACEIKANSVPFREQDPTTGAYYERTVTTVNCECLATLHLADARDGHQIAVVSETGFTAFTAAERPEEGDKPELEAARDTARKMAKKLRAALKR